MQIRQEINILDSSYSGTGTVSSGEIVQLDTTQYNGTVTYYFEAVFSGAASNTGNIRLTRSGTTTDDATIAGSTSGTASRVRSSSFTPPSGQTKYIVRLVGDGIRSQTVKVARIIVIQNGTLLTSSETQIELGNKETSTSTTAAALSSPKYFTFTASNWNGTLTVFLDATLSNANSKALTELVVQEDNGSFGGWSTIVPSAVDVFATSPTYGRSSSFSLADGKHYRVAISTSSAKSTATIYNAKIIIDQTGAIEDSYNKSNQDAIVRLNSLNDNGESQSFTPNASVYIVACDFYLNKTGSPTGSLVAKLYNHSGTYGTSSIPTGVALAVSDPFDLSTLTTSFQLIKFIFSTRYQTSSIAGTHYCITVETSGSPTLDGSNYVDVGIDNTSPTHGGNLAQRAWGGSTWSATSSSDMIFFVYSSFVDKLESQYLLLNTKSTATGLQIFNTLFDPAEWLGVINIYKHAQDAIGSTANSRLKDITNGNAILTNSPVTGANQQIGSNITDMPGTADQIDTDIVTVGTEVDASRILVQVTPVLPIASASLDPFSSVETPIGY